MVMVAASAAICSPFSYYNQSPSLSTPCCKEEWINELWKWGREAATLSVHCFLLMEQCSFSLPLPHWWQGAAVVVSCGRGGGGERAAAIQQWGGEGRGGDSKLANVVMLPSHQCLVVQSLPLSSGRNWILTETARRETDQQFAATGYHLTGQQ